MLQDNLPPHSPSITDIKTPEAEKAATLALHAVEIRLLGQRVASDVIEIGQLLTECKKLVGHGNWGAWLEREFGWTDRQARRFMSVQQLAGKTDNLSDLNIDVSSLYAIAAPNTPDEVRDEIIDRAKREPVRHKDITALLKPKKNKGTVTNGGPSSAAPVTRGEIVPLHPQVKEAAAHFSTWREDRKAREAQVVKALAAFVRFLARQERLKAITLTVATMVDDSERFDRLFEDAIEALRNGESMGFLDKEEAAS
jgi:hypothetical protein